MPIKPTIRLDKGRTLTRTLRVSNDSGPVNLTGRTYEAKAVDSYRHSKFSFEISVVIANQSTNPGEINLVIPGGATKDLDVYEEKQFFYDIVEVSTNKTLFKGLLYLSPGAI